MDAQLGAKAADVRPYRGVADPQLACDLAAGDALGHQTQDLLLARREALELGVHRPTLVEQGRDRSRSYQRSSTGDDANCVDDLGCRPGFVDEGARPRLEGGEASRIAILACQEDELGLWPDLADARAGVRSCPVGQAKVEYHDVWVQLGRKRYRLAHRAYVADHRHVRLIVEQGAQALGDHLVVFDDQNADRVYAQGAVGIQNSTRLPWPGSLEILHQPPARRARSLSDSRPRCPGRCSRSATRKPLPLSTINPWTPPSSALTSTSTRVAAACLSTFVMASTTCLKTVDLISYEMSSGRSRSTLASAPVSEPSICRRSRIVSSNPPGISSAGGRTSKSSLRTASSACRSRPTASSIGARLPAFTRWSWSSAAVSF